MAEDSSVLVGSATVGLVVAASLVLEVWKEEKVVEAPFADDGEVGEDIRPSSEAETDWLATPVLVEDSIAAPVCDEKPPTLDEELGVISLEVRAVVQVEKVVSELACCVASKGLVGL